MTSEFDKLLALEGPVALIISEPLEPVSGKDAVLFPPTFAAPEGSDDKPNYIIDTATATCLIDTVGAQANRLEPIFKRADLAELTPKVTVSIGERELNLLDAGHRAADAVIRFSDQRQMLGNAFLAYRDRGDAEPLAKIAPTSLVFGAWDSRDSGAKIPRLVESTIRAYGVARLERAAQYFSSLVGSRGALKDGDPVRREIDSIPLKEQSKQGLADSPSGLGPGGIFARDGIRREAILNLVALRALGTKEPDATLKLQRYILGLALVAFTAPAELYLRQGCLLVGSPEQPASTKMVRRNGQREPFELSQESAIAFAKDAARIFGVGTSVRATFEPKAVKEKLADKKAKTEKKNTAATPKVEP